jgi:hypothetical protein
MNMDPVPDKFHPNSSNGAIYFLWLTSFFLNRSTSISQANLWTALVTR